MFSPYLTARLNGGKRKFLAENLDVFEYLLEFSTDFGEILNGGKFRKEWPKRRKVEKIRRKILAENFDVLNIRWNIPLILVTY